MRVPFDIIISPFLYRITCNYTYMDTKKTLVMIMHVHNTIQIKISWIKFYNFNVESWHKFSSSLAGLSAPGVAGGVGSLAGTGIQGFIKA